MNCSIFQDRISDYLDGELVAREKAEFAAHRLSCRDCREVFNDVRDTVQTLNVFARDDYADSLPALEALEARIVDATSAGEMLSCGEFDKMIERYFDGVILGPTFQSFQAHFAGCWKCRRLLRGIEEAKEMMREAKEEMDLPANLPKRIMAATIGQERDTFFDKLSRSLKVGQWVAAMLIFAASGMLINYRYGSVENMATQKQELFQQAVIDTGSMAVAGMQFLSVKFKDTKEQIKKRRQTEAALPQPSATPTDHQPPTTDHRSQ
jgi:predicted anti-sigma-YlaC factor YlaD